MDIRDPSHLCEQCFIGGKWVGAPATPATNPATGAEIAKGAIFRRYRDEGRDRHGARAARACEPGREGSHYGVEEFVEVKYMLMGGLDL
jgi:hypothetical protein